MSERESGTPAPGPAAPRREFPLGDVLSVTTGRLVAPRGIVAVYEILAYLTGEAPMTHQLPRFQDEARPHVLCQHPALAAVDPSGCTPETWRLWLSSQEATYGRTCWLTPIPADDHARRDPVDELRAMVGPDKPIIIVNPETGEARDA